jgi:hypothetical protein
MRPLRHHLLVIIGTTFLFLATLVLNEWLFKYTKFASNINWIYLPAGMRVICTLLFGAMGAIGILIASWIGCIFYFFPGDPMRCFFGGIVSALAPYLVYVFAKRALGLRASLSNLTARRLLLLILMYSLASPALLTLSGGLDHAGTRFLVMFVGDLSGTLIVIYMIKLGLRIISLTYSGTGRASASDERPKHAKRLGRMQ